GERRHRARAAAQPAPARRGDRHQRAGGGIDRRPGAASERRQAGAGGSVAEGVRLKAALAEARYGIRVRRRRSLLTGLGIALAAAMLIAALVVSDSLGFGFDRAARAADLPNIIVRFSPQPAGRVAQRVAALPDVAAYTVRPEVNDVGLATANDFAGNGVVEVVDPGRRGYAIVAGRYVSDADDVVVERGLAASWHLGIGDNLK